jgi:hypothetical protein
MEFLKYFSQILGIVATILAGFYIPYMNYRQKKRDEEAKAEQIKRDNQAQDSLAKRDEEIDKKQETRIKIITNRLEEIESVVTNIESALKIHLTDDNFRKDFREVIRSTSLNIIEKSYSIRQVYKNILSYYADSIEKFGLCFYYSNKRKGAQWDRDKGLTEEKTILLEDFLKFIDSNIIAYKIYKSSKVCMSDFLSDTKINAFASLEILVQDLIRNGLSESDVKEKFRIHIDKFFKVFITSSIVWEQLENPFKENI